MGGGKPGVCAESSLAWHPLGERRVSTNFKINERALKTQEKGIKLINIQNLFGGLVRPLRSKRWQMLNLGVSVCDRTKPGL